LKIKFGVSSNYHFNGKYVIKWNNVECKSGDLNNEIASNVEIQIALVNSNCLKDVNSGTLLVIFRGNLTKEELKYFQYYKLS